ncbi:hypothetical protein CLAFUW4_08836 [Fulvia fulva]|uniref:Uncharacterized protein n=1 Tax=Passalora fulva TaxID=5499 RepID=A0A9Q8PGB9_PASFU|nr:uncharacterized protein CLAFUR5_08942 [Fulvia fulva]KAK4614127.1 hypothetical protein CLAFUR4_08842 [Fulvia fulva]KAK4614727.1 hypothetical protein CLAFUR0_08834 [Fulvia fulva]UJO21892.1 hypothetical protein CLAFUR5_08942 [Fulvia fulva]WPV20389.1 hypothetical protein CLAFUW4_08836 [Fulvia fulva]WPV34799.1 hypothetical protein CLAFUW7_08837 [Fulvia fulva]
MSSLQDKANQGTRRKPKSRSRKGSDDTESGESQSRSPEIEEQRTRPEQPLVWTNDNQNSHDAAQATQRTLLAAGQKTPLRAPPRPSPSPERQATSSSHHTNPPTPTDQGASTDFLEALRPFLAETSEASPLKIATQAVSLSTMAKQSCHQHLLPQAQNQYTRALHALQEDLKNPHLTLSDATLLTVLTFALYESNCQCTSPQQSMAAWAKHIDGAITLLKSRGLEQLNESSSYRMFRAIRGQILAGVGPRAQRVFGTIGYGACSGDEAGNGNAVAVRIRGILSGWQGYLARWECWVEGG